MFEKEFNYFKAHQDELVKKYNEKHIVIRGEEVVGAFDSPGDAYLDSLKKYPRGTFMIQKCISGPEAYTITISSAVARFAH